MKKSSALAALLFGLILAGCVNAKITPDEIFGAGACSAPCWHGLAPGQSGLEDLKAFPDSKEPLKILYSTIDTDGRCQTWGLGVRVSEQEFDAREVILVDNKVRLIRGAPPEDLTLGQVVARFGPPERILPALEQGPEGPYYTLDVYYPSKGLAFSMKPNQSDVGGIRQNTPVDDMEYFAPGDLVSYYNSMRECVDAPELLDDRVAAKLRHTIPWPGYGKIEVINTD